MTGGTGFLGRHIVERLLAVGRPVTVLARRKSVDLEAKGARFIEASLDDEAAVMAACAGVGTVFHVAAKVGVWGAYDGYYRTNVLGTRALLEGCRRHGVARLVHTSTPSVVYNGKAIAGGDESMPRTTACPSAYALTKAIAEREVLEANSGVMRTVALRPHLIWGVGDPHLVPRVLERAAAGRLRIVGGGQNRVDMVHVRNAASAHLRAEAALGAERRVAQLPPAAGRAYFITNGEPVRLWEWINGLLRGLGRPAVTRQVPLGAAMVAGALCEAFWRVTGRAGDPPMTRFVAAELAKDHWFSIEAARRDLGYAPQVSMAEGTAELVAHLRAHGTPVS